MTSNDDILRALGQLEGTVKGIREDIQEMRQDISKHNSNIYERVRSLEASRNRIWGAVATLPIIGGVASWFIGKGDV